jgi:hypothetical protein
VAARQVAILSILFVISGCKPKEPAQAHCSAALPAEAEVRDGLGAPELALRHPPAGAPAERWDVCDAAGSSQALYTESAGRTSVALLNPAGDPRSRAAAGEGGGEATLTLAEWVVRRDAGPPPGPLRLHDEGGLLRVLDAAGVPLGQLGRDGDKGVAYDAAGVPRATVERVDGRCAVRARDGAVVRYVFGVQDPRAAAALALDALPVPERLLLSRFLDRK